MSAQRDDHLTRTHYVDRTQALIDARRVLHDLEALAEGRTVVAADEFAFLARRAGRLVSKCVDHALAEDHR